MTHCRRGGYASAGEQIPPPNLPAGRFGVLASVGFGVYDGAMQPIIYDVSVSADGLIDGPDGDISKFTHDGPVVDDYMARLQGYACAIMGRATYEFGYRFGMAPGDNPYPHMQTVVMSRQLVLPETSPVEVVREDAAARVETLRQTVDGPIYLCGGGQFAGWLLSLRMITTLRLKRAPIVLGSGTRLFGDNTAGCDAVLQSSKLYDNGVLLQEFRLA